MSDISYLAAPARPRTLGYYIALFPVAAVYLITPISWAYIAHVALHGHGIPSGISGMFLTWAVLEAAFSIYHFYLAQSIQVLSPSPMEDLSLLQSIFIQVLQSGRPPKLPDGASTGDHERRPGSPLESIQRLDTDDPRAVDFRNSMRTWFRKVPWSEITKEGMLTWLSWSCFDLPLSDALASPQQRAILYEALELIERRSGTVLPDGKMTVVPLRLTMDPVAVWSRPLILYVFVGLSSWAVRAWYQVQWGFVQGEYEGMEYLLRIPRDWTPEKGRTDPLSAPVVAFHGLGVGLLQYKNLLSNLADGLSTHPLLIPLQPHISQDIWHPHHLRPLGKDRTVKALSGLIRGLGFGPDEETDEDGGVIFLSHSNGSVAHAWMMKECPELLRRSCFVDPVTFCLWEGDVCYNFVYRSPTNAMELLMWYFVGSELGIANLLQRHFVWSHNILWFEEIKNPRDPFKTLFLIGGRDSIVDTERVRLYLNSHGVRKGLIFDPEGRHGSALLRNGKGLATVISWVRGQCTFSDSD